MVVIESKWANAPWSYQRGVINSSGDDPTCQAWRAADKIKRFLASEGVLVEPVPVLVQWGPGGLPVDWTDRWVEDVLVIRHPRSTIWLDQLGAGYIDDATRVAAIEVLERQRQLARDRVE